MLTASISPNNKPIRSNLIEVRNPINTRPIASVEWASRPSKESPASFVLFCKLIKSKATTADIIKTENVILKLKELDQKTKHQKVFFPFLKMDF